MESSAAWYRREVRAAGLRSDLPMDFTRHRADRLPLAAPRVSAAVDEARRSIDACTDGTLPPSPPS